MYVSFTGLFIVEIYIEPCFLVALATFKEGSENEVKARNFCRCFCLVTVFRVPEMKIKRYLFNFRV